MIVGSMPIFDGPVSRYVARTGVSMLSLEYRLAPEHPHPAPVEDAYAGLARLTAPGRLADAAGLPPAYIDDAIAFDADVSRRAPRAARKATATACCGACDAS